MLHDLRPTIGLSNQMKHWNNFFKYYHIHLSLLDLHWIPVTTIYLAKIKLTLGLDVPGPVGDHLIVYISLEWAWRSWTQVSCFILQIFNVISSEQEASKFPWGSHLIAFTSFYFGWIIERVNNETTNKFTDKFAT